MKIDRDKIASIIALLKIAKYDTEILGEKRDEGIDYLKKQLSIHSVVVPKGTLKTFEDLQEETKKYRKSGDAIVWKNK